MSTYNEKIPWVLILGGCVILAIRLIVALFSSLGVIDWLAIITIVAGLLIWASYDLPLVGQLENPVHQHLAQDFIEGSRNHIGIPNVVTSILASYRGYDTFGETVVIYTAGIAVLVLLYDRVSKTSKTNKEKNK